MSQGTTEVVHEEDNLLEDELDSIKGDLTRDQITHAKNNEAYRSRTEEG
jgi:hypothetical protein